MMGILSIFFLALVGLLVYFVAYAFNFSLIIDHVERGKRRKNVMFMLLGLAGWLGLTGFLASDGWFLVMDPVPPRLLYALVPAFGAAFVLGFLPYTKHLARGLNGEWIVLFQSFRIVMELILWLLYKNDLIAEIVTWHGRNLDILIGVTAPLVAYYGYMRPNPMRKMAFAWNIVGIGMLFNVVGHGFLSAPTPLRQFFEPVSTEIVATFPWVWLPMFVVPLAVFAHLVALQTVVRR